MFCVARGKGELLTCCHVDECFMNASFVYPQFDEKLDPVRYSMAAVRGWMRHNRAVELKS